MIGLRSLLARVIGWCARRLQRSEVVGSIESLVQEQRIVFIDIDNTIADTWPSLVKGRSFGSEEERLSGLPPLRGTIRFVTERYADADLWVFLSFRPIQYRALTRRWLEDVGAWREPSVVCLVDSVAGKLEYLEMAMRRTTKIVLIDDLSYNHENGEIKFYDQVIRRAKTLGVEYHGYPMINEVNRR